MCDSARRQFPLAELIHALILGQTPPLSLREWLSARELDALIGLMARLIRLTAANESAQSSVGLARELAGVVCRAVHDPTSLEQALPLAIRGGLEAEARALLEAASLTVAAVRWPGSAARRFRIEAVRVAG